MKKPWSNTTTKTERRAKVIVQALREYGDEIRAKDVIELVKDKIDLGNNPGQVMNDIMKVSPEIKRIRYGFYQYIEPKKAEDKKDVKEEAEVSEYKDIKVVDIPDVSDDSKKLLESFRKDTPVSYRVGDTFEGVVTGLETYGAFLQDKSGKAGLIHITQIKKGTVDNIERHFKIGDRVKAKVSFIRGSKVSLNTFGIDLPDYFEETSYKLEEAPKNTLGSNPSAIKVLEKFIATEPKEEEKVEVPKLVKKENRSEIDEALKYLQGIVGPISPAAKAKAEEVVSRVGLVKFMISLMETKDNFEVDLGLHFLTKVDEKVRDRL